MINPQSVRSSSPDRFKCSNILRTIHKRVKTRLPDTWRNSPVLWPYRFTECSKAFLSVEPLSCTRSKVPPKGRTEIRSSIVMEPTENRQRTRPQSTTSEEVRHHSLSGSGFILLPWNRATHRFGCARPQTSGCLRR